MRKLTQEYVENYCLEHGYRVMSLYVNAQTKIKLQNIETGEIGEMTFGNFENGRRFDNPKATKKLTQQSIESYCEPKGYRVLSPYVDSKTKITLQNIETGEIGKMRFDHFKQGCRFDNPKATKKPTYQQYIQPFIDEGYTVLIDEKDCKNINAKTKIDVICHNKHKWSVARDTFTSHNQRCPMCNQNLLGGMSFGERLVYQILQGNNIDFEREKSILISENNYRFDYYFEIKEFGYTDKFFIEYDGIQHYHDFGGYMFGNLKKRRGSDEIKDRYARENNIQMIRIPWLNDTIDKILFVINGETGLGLHSVNVQLPTIQQVADYYLTHERQETMDKFNLSNAAVNRYFKQINGMSKKEYLGTSKQKISDYYLTHSIEETMDKFNISNVTIQRYFKKEYGMSRRDHLKTLDK